MPFGLTNTPAAFMDLMNMTRPSWTNYYCVFYDILVYSQNHGEHEEHLRTVLGTLRERKQLTKFSKCQFWLDRVTFFGHVITKDSISMESLKIEAFVEWKWPTCVMEVPSFLGLAGYYIRFVEGFSVLVASLMRLTIKGVDFQLSDKCEHIFQELKCQLVSVLILTLPFPRGHFTIYGCL